MAISANSRKLTPSLQHEQILRIGVLLGPGLELAQGHFVEYFLDDRRCRGGALQDGRREGVRVRVKTNHPLDIVDFWIHSLSNDLCRRTETGQALTCTQVFGAVPM